jgi:hypothetical protein
LAAVAAAATATSGTCTESAARAAFTNSFDLKKKSYAVEIDQLHGKGMLKSDTARSQHTFQTN